MIPNINLMQQQSLAYLEALQASDLSAILALFGPDAVIFSPLYGEILARDFYPSLLADSKQSELEHLDTFHTKESRSVALYFHYIWTMRSGEKTRFHCVDILTFSPDYLIESLRIIYDTARTRTAFDKL